MPHLRLSPKHVRAQSLHIKGTLIIRQHRVSPSLCSPIEREKYTLTEDYYLLVVCTLPGKLPPYTFFLTPLSQEIPTSSKQSAAGGSSSKQSRLFSHGRCSTNNLFKSELEKLCGETSVNVQIVLVAAATKVGVAFSDYVDYLFILDIWKVRDDK